MKYSIKNLSNYLKPVAVVGSLISFGLIHSSVFAGHKSHANNDANPACSKFEVSSYGGDGGVRFMHDVNNYIHVSNSSQYGKICKSGYVTVELGKRDLHSKVAFHINRQQFYFGANEHADSYKNNWYRKYVKVYLPERHQRPKYSQKSYSYNKHAQHRWFNRYNYYNNRFLNKGHYQKRRNYRNHRRHIYKQRHRRYPGYSYNKLRHYKKYRNHYGYKH